MVVWTHCSNQEAVDGVVVDAVVREMGAVEPTRTIVSGSGEKNGSDGSPRGENSWPHSCVYLVPR